MKKLPQFNRVRTGIRAQNLYSQMKFKTGLSINVLARYGLCLSLSDRSIPNPQEYDEKGMELLPSVLFGEHEKMFHAIFLKRLQNDKLDPELYLQEMMRAHLNRGAGLLFPRISELSDFQDNIHVKVK